MLPSSSEISSQRTPCRRGWFGSRRSSPTRTFVYVSTNTSAQSRAAFSAVDRARSIALDLSVEEGQEMFRDPATDVVVHNFRVGEWKSGAWVRGPRGCQLGAGVLCAVGVRRVGSSSRPTGVRHYHTGREWIDEYYWREKWIARMRWGGYRGYWDRDVRDAINSGDSFGAGYRYRRGTEDRCEPAGWASYVDELHGLELLCDGGPRRNGWEAIPRYPAISSLRDAGRIRCSSGGVGKVVIKVLCGHRS